MQAAQPPIFGQQAGAALQGTSGRGHRLRGWRKWLLRVAIAIAAPLLFLTLLELALRLFGLGYPTGFFLGSGDGYVANERFAHRFAPPRSAPEPLPIVLPAAKPAGTHRIFIFGESAALGVPAPQFSFARILEAMLAEACPDARFEVVNTAMMGINSHAILPIARDAAALQPDLYLMYMGNNEVCGYFGPMTVDAGQAPWSRRGIDWLLWCKSLRTGQLLQKWLVPDSSEPSDMAAFLNHQVPADDPRRATTEAHFRANLADICRIGRRAGAKVLVSTVAVNLKDCAPFASMHRAGLPAEQRKQWEALYQQGIDAQHARQLENAIQRYGQAERIDDRYAELHFRTAQCLLALRRPDEARKRYQRACDLDTLQFRTDSAFNQIIRQVAGQEGVRLVDSAGELARQSPDGITGQSMLHEHVHLTFDGNYALARAMLPAVLESLALQAKNPALSREVCAKALALTSLAELRMAEPIAAVLTKPPFVNQFDIATRQENARRAVERLRQRVITADQAAELAMCQAALQRRPADWMIHQTTAELLARAGDAGGAMAHMQECVRLAPGNRHAQAMLGQLLIGQRKLDEADAHYAAMRKRWPGSGAACKAQGDILLARGQVDAAVARYREAERINPDEAPAAEAVVAALLSQKRYEEAETEYRRAYAAQPSSLARALAALSRQQGRNDEAAEVLRSAVSAMPADMPLRQDLARALLSAGRTDEAITAFRELVRLDSRSPATLNALGAALQVKGQHAEAERCYKEALAIQENPASLSSLGGMAMARGDHAAAIGFYLRAVELSPADPVIRSNLGGLLMVRKEYHGAIEHLLAAVRIRNDDGSSQAMLGQCYLKAGRLKEAVTHYRQAASLNQREPQMLASLAWVLATAPDDALRDGKEAVKFAEEACDKTLYKNPMMLCALAASYAEVGRYSQAERVATVAAQVAEADRNRGLAQTITGHLAFYRSGRPVRELAISQTTP